MLEATGLSQTLSRSDLAEVWAFGAVLDLWKHRPEQCGLPLWPACLRQVEGFRDLPMLDEACKMLEDGYRVRLGISAFEACSTVFSVLAPSPAAQARLVAQYRNALLEEALRRGWSL